MKAPAPISTHTLSSLSERPADPASRFARSGAFLFVGGRGTNVWGRGTNGGHLRVGRGALPAHDGTVRRVPNHLHIMTIDVSRRDRVMSRMPHMHRLARLGSGGSVVRFCRS